MPISASAKKSLRVSLRRAGENKIIKAQTKRQIKDTTSVEGLSAAYSQLDKAAKRNVIHKNKAARLKSRLAKRLQTAA